MNILIHFRRYTFISFREQNFCLAELMSFFAEYTGSAL